MNMQTRTMWESAHGTVAIEEMETSHIINTIAYIQMRLSALEKAAKRTNNRLLRKEIEERSRWIDLFIDELNKREVPDA